MKKFIAPLITPLFLFMAFFVPALHAAGEEDTYQGIYNSAVDGINEVLDASGSSERATYKKIPKAPVNNKKSTAKSTSKKKSSGQARKTQNFSKSKNAKQTLMNTAVQGIGAALSSEINRPRPSQLHPDRDYSNSAFSIAPPPPGNAGEPTSGQNTMAGETNGNGGQILSATTASAPVWSDNSQPKKVPTQIGIPEWGDTAQNPPAASPTFDTVKNSLVNTVLSTSGLGLEILNTAEETENLCKELGLPLPENTTGIKEWAHNILEVSNKILPNDYKDWDNKVAAAETSADVLAGYQSIKPESALATANLENIQNDVKPAGRYDPSANKAYWHKRPNYETVTISRNRAGGLPTQWTNFNLKTDIWNSTANIYHRPDFHPWAPDSGDPKNGSLHPDGRVFSEYQDNWVSRETWEAEELMLEKQSQDQALRKIEIEREWDHFYEGVAEPPIDSDIHEAARAMNESKHRGMLVEKKWDIINRVWDSKLSFGGKAINNLEKRMETAITNGATASDLDSLLKSFYRHQANQDQAAAANAEYDDIVNSQKIEAANAAIGIASGLLGLTGIVAEAGASGVSAYLSGDDVGNAVYNAAYANLPTGTGKLLYDYFGGKEVSVYECFTSILMDGVKLMGLKNDIADSKTLNKLLKMPDNCVGNVVKSIENAAKGEQIFLKGLNSAKNKVQNFLDLHHTCQLDAIKKGKLFDINDYPDLKTNFWNVQSDKSAIYLLNQGADDINSMFNLPKRTVLSKFNGIKDTVYKSNNKKVAALLENRYKKAFAGEIEAKPLFATNPSTGLKASYDQDITYSIVDKKTGKVLRNVGEDELQEIVSDVYYKDTGSPPDSVWDPDGITKIIEPKASKAKRFTTWTDQVAVSKGAEAYGKGAPSLGFLDDKTKSGLFLNRLEYGNTFKFKGNHFGVYADRIQNEIKMQTKLGNMARVNELLPYKQKFEIEQCRQWSKQMKNHVMPALDTIQEVCRKKGFDLPKMPPNRLTRAMKVMEDIGSRGPDGRFITPEAADVLVRGLGFNSLADVGNEMGDYLLAIEKRVQKDHKLYKELSILEYTTKS